jgi:hypothetical protein
VRDLEGLLSRLPARSERSRGRRLAEEPLSGSHHTGHLRALAGRVAHAYIERAATRAILLVGSAATGDADEYSDLDLILYYDRVPAAETVTLASAELDPSWYRITPWSDESGEPDADGLGERYGLGTLECQVAHISIGAFEREIERLVGNLEIDEELLKIMSGLFEGRPLFGEDVIERWRESAAYTPELQRAVIQKRWSFFPWWYFEERLRRRDATAWRHEVLAHSVYAIVGTLAALNGSHFSAFEFKRAGRFVSGLTVSPRDLAERLDSLFELAESRSTAELGRLVAETRELVGHRFPDLDLSVRWAGRSTEPGEREEPWG